MNRQHAFSILRWLGFSCLAMLLAGCGGGSDHLDQKEKDHMLQVAKLSGEYTATNMKPPSSLDELKKWALKEGKASEEDFVSTRDQQPYLFSSGGMAGILIYEQTGKNGKCYIYMMGGIHEQDREQAVAQAKRMGGISKGEERPRRRGR
jgi:hypothetical protein